jgi:hypothetical protein
MVPSRWKVLVVSVVVACGLSLGVLRPGPVSAGQDQVAVCHLRNNGTYYRITIAEPAYRTHVAHGDAQVGQEVPGAPGFVFAGNCNIVIAGQCEDFIATGCFVQENISGYGCWVPPQSFPELTEVEQCQSLDSCARNGGGPSDGSCYKWADCALCPPIYPNPNWP